METYGDLEGGLERDVAGRSRENGSIKVEGASGKYIFFLQVKSISLNK